MSEIKFVRVDQSQFGCDIGTSAGSRITVVGSHDSVPSIAGDSSLMSNASVHRNAWAFAVHEEAYRRLRSEEKRKSHRAQAKHHGTMALSIAEMVDAVGTRKRDGWCSACFAYATHTQVGGRWKVANTDAYLCGECGAPTAACVAPKCSNMANRNTSRAGLPRYCAEHRHDIANFETAATRLSSLEEFDVLVDWKARNLAAATKRATGVVAGTALVAPLALLAAPAIGGAIGASVLGGGLSGAAATSHGLAMLGLGSLASGGFGMAGGTAVIVAAGAGLGGAMGASTTAAYVNDDKSFRIEKLKDGKGAPVVLAAGFLSEGQTGWGPWKPLVEERWPRRPVYRVTWGSKELKALGGIFGPGLAAKGAASYAKTFAGKATSLGAKNLSYLGWATMIPGIAKNPWTVALNRCEMTSGVLADLLSRTGDEAFVLVGHSLGARIMIQTAEILAASGGGPSLESVHLLGAAAPSKGDWRLLHESAREGVWNYHSRRDPVLAYLYRYAQFKGPAAGSVGIKTRFTNIRNVDVSRKVGTHDAYFTGVSLKKP